jgi:hypothetical protein
LGVDDALLLETGNARVRREQAFRPSHDTAGGRACGSPRRLTLTFATAPKPAGHAERQRRGPGHGAAVDPSESTAAR